MNQTRCSNGHYYDHTKHTSCPYCGIQIDGQDKTVRATQRSSDSGYLEETQRFASPPVFTGGETVRVMPAKMGIDPVVGWLVCVKGPEKGRDYRIRSERNFIGRGSSMDICIAGDERISRDKHAILTYNPKSGTFSLANGEARGLIYLNGAEVGNPVALQPYDLIEMGASGFMFMPFCSERFQWLADE